MIIQADVYRSTRKYGYSLDRKDPTKGYTKDNYGFAKWVLSLEGGVLP